MKDFPFFTTDSGVAGLVLKEIPYRGEGYIHLRQSDEPENLLEECISFCRACGADRIYASGSDILDRYPLYTAVWRMQTVFRPDEELICNLWPVVEENVGEWRRICNEQMKDIPNAATLECKDEKELLASGSAYFIHEKGELLGIGWLKEEQIAVLAAVRKGAGAKVLHTLLSLIPDRQVTLEVASANERARKFYEKHGFLRTAEISKWHQVF